MDSVAEWPEFLRNNGQLKDRYFAIKKVRGGNSDLPPVIFSSGFGSPRQHVKGNKWHGWKRIITQRFPDNPVYRVYWNTKHAPSRNLVKFLKHPRTINEWNQAKAFAHKAGEALAGLIAATPDQTFILIGHSLGGRVMLETAIELATNEQSRGRRIAEIHLLGAAFRRIPQAKMACTSVHGKIYNYHSKRDKVLAGPYRLSYSTTSGSRNAIGLKGAPFQNKKWKDIDVTKKVGADHSAYKKKIKLKNSID